MRNRKEYIILLTTIDNVERYNLLLNVLDNLREEAPQHYASYHPKISDTEALNKARSKAYIHLFLKARFGIISFNEREKFITDGIDDAGIDAYYIEQETRKVYFIQSKFRTNKDNFEEKTIKIEEILSMDIDRILDGFMAYENGVSFNSKIISMSKKIRDIPDIGRYRYEIIILANAKDVVQSKLRKLFGYSTTIINFEECYSQLLFPLICGNYYNSPDLNIFINISDKSTGSKISYRVETGKGKCEITVVFVPLEEIAKIMLKYKNSILKFNPRCYLDLSESPINREIHKTIITKQSNEFALYNNGITMLSDDSSFNEKIGQRDKAVLCVTNPQIINGGQTAYSLARIYEDNSAMPDQLSQIFSGKEVLLKVITFVDKIDLRSKMELIEEISNATNQQNAVTYADRHSNDNIQYELQAFIFREFGQLYERKRGEFSEGIKSGYINESDILSRTVFVTIALACSGRTAKQNKVFKQSMSYMYIFDEKKFADYKVGIQVYNYLKNNYASDQNITSKNILKYGFHALLFIVISIYNERNSEKLDEIYLKEIVDHVIDESEQFEEYAMSQPPNNRFFKTKTVRGEIRLVANFSKYYKSHNALIDMTEFFGDPSKLNILPQ